MCFTSNQFRLISRATSSQFAALPTPNVTSADTRMFHKVAVPRNAIIVTYAKFFMSRDENPYRATARVERPVLLDFEPSSFPRSAV